MDKNNFFVYILLCNNNTLYTGITNNLKNRVRKHVLGKGANYTKQNTPIKILIAWKVDSVNIALSLEHFIKKQSKKTKLLFIENSVLLKKVFIKYKNINRVDITIRKISNIEIDKINMCIESI
jgi:putative endonuclease